VAAVVMLVEQHRNQGETDTNANEQTQGGGNGDRGAQHGRGFGRGAYPLRR
jgi:hypothetical protein